MHALAFGAVIDGGSARHVRCSTDGMTPLCRIAALFSCALSLVLLASGCSGSCSEGAWVCARFGSSDGDGEPPWTPPYEVEAEYLETELGFGIGPVSSEDLLARATSSPNGLYVLWSDADEHTIGLHFALGETPFSALEAGRTYDLEPFDDGVTEWWVHVTFGVGYDQQLIDHVRLEVLEQGGGQTRFILWADFTDREGVARTVLTVMTVREI